MDIKLRKLLELARAVRKELERVYPFKDMAGLCCCVSKTIHEKARAANIPVVFAYGTFNGWVHCWLEYDGNIIDATATQFGVIDKILVTPISDTRYKPGEPGLCAKDPCAKSPKSRVTMRVCKDHGMMEANT